MVTTTYTRSVQSSQPRDNRTRDITYTIVHDNPTNPRAYYHEPDAMVTIAFVQGGRVTYSTVPKAPTLVRSVREYIVDGRVLHDLYGVGIGVLVARGVPERQLTWLS